MSKPLSDKEFEMLARQHGFNPNQITFLQTYMARRPHKHDMEEVEGLEEIADRVEEISEELALADSSAEPEEEEDEEEEES